MTRPSDEAGFTLIEVIVGVAILASAAAGLFIASVTVAHAEAQARSVQVTAETAQDVVTDIRALAAYDPSVLDAPANGPARHFTVDGTPVSVSFAAAGNNAYDVVVQAGGGARTVAVRTRIVQEAPPPGAMLDPAPPLHLWTPQAPPTAGPEPRPQPTQTPCRHRPGPLSSRARTMGVLPPCAPEGS